MRLSWGNCTWNILKLWFLRSFFGGVVVINGYNHGYNYNPHKWPLSPRGKWNCTPSSRGFNPKMFNPWKLRPQLEFQLGPWNFGRTFLHWIRGAIFLFFLIFSFGLEAVAFHFSMVFIDSSIICKVCLLSFNGFHSCFHGFHSFSIVFLTFSMFFTYLSMIFISRSIVFNDLHVFRQLRTGCCSLKKPLN